MSARNTTVNLDLSKQGCIPSLTISQYDVGVALNFLVMDGNAAFAGFESTDVIKLKGTRPSGTGFQIEASNYSSNWVSFHSTMELTAESGSTTCEIEITKSETEILHTANFYIEIEAAAHPDGTIDQDIEQFNQIAQRVGAYATTALMRAEDALAAKNAAQQSESKAEEYMNAAMEASKSAAASKEDIHEYIDDSEAWARGTRDGVDVQSTDETYHNNAKFFAERSSQNAEAWARGTRGGTAVPQTDETYQNNAKYYAEQSSESSMAAGSSASEAAASAQEAAATLAGAVKPAAIDTEFNTSTDYAVGDTVVYQGRLYEFTSAHTAGAWNASHVQAISVMDEVSDLKGDLNECVLFTPQTLTDAQKAQARTNIGITESGNQNDIVYSGNPEHQETIFDLNDVSPGDILFYDLTVSDFSQSGYIYFIDSEGVGIFFIGKPNVINVSFESVGCVMVPSNFHHATAYKSGGTFIVKYIKKIIDYGEFANQYMALYYGKKVNQVSRCGYNRDKAYVAKTGEMITASNCFAGTPISVLPNTIVRVNFDLNSKHIGVCYYDLEMKFVSGETSIGKTKYHVPDNCYFIAITVANLVTATIYLEQPLETTIKKVIGLNSLYTRLDVHRYGTSYNGWTQLMSGCSRLFDNKVYISYACKMRHDPTIGDGSIGGVLQIDTVSIDGIHEHLKTITPEDFGFAPSDATTQRYPGVSFISSRDGQHIIGIATVVEVSNRAYLPHKTFIAKFDKNFNVLEYKQMENVTSFLYGSIVISPSGKILYTAYDGSGNVYLYTSTQAYSGNINDVTFTQTIIFSRAEIGYDANEAAIGYFNNKLIILARNNSPNGTVVKITNNLDGTDGWSTATYISGVQIHYPTLLPYYKGKYLLVLASVSGSSNRPPMLGYLDVDNLTFKSLKQVDDSLLAAYNGATGIVDLGGDNYGVLYYQETPGTPNQLAANQCYAGVYYKVINTNAFFPEKMYWDMESSN